MIPIGNKIEVIASSTKGKGAKIRKGSLGYISTISDSYYVGGESALAGKMLVTPAKIVFTRFGYEKKPRNEVKFVALIHPTINPETVKNKKTYLERIVKQALDYTREIKDIFRRKDIKINKVTAIAVHTINTTENVTNNQNDCSAWLRSVAISGVLHKILFAGPNDSSKRTLDRLVNNNTHNLNWLHSCTHSKAGVKQYVATLFEGDKKGLISFIVRMHELLQLNSLQRLHDFQNFKPSLGRGGKVFGMCWELYSMNLIKHTEMFAARSHHTRNVINQTKRWFTAYNEIAKKSI